MAREYVRCEVFLTAVGRVGTAEVTQILANVSAIYSPELTVGYSPYVSALDSTSQATE